ncbi:unnamed protein product [Rhizophagus irregularis]|uniref:Uncharacterized protein n=1 Tax=Rhizophagus irregularis TaxID=588596 RepID=A0A915ZT26_9GLOM|nr:unnamed protein product [Rhizophagus irregularis]
MEIISKEDALVNFKKLLDVVELSDNKPLKTKYSSKFSPVITKTKTAYDEDVARVFLTGVTPVVLAEFISDNIKEGIVSWLKEENDGYFFRHNQPEEIFNTAHILYYVRKLMKQKSKLDDSWDPSVILNIQ